GGISPEEEVLGTAELLDLSAHKSRVIDSRHLPRVGHSCVKLNNGKILLIGGANDKQLPEPRVETFDPASQSFSVIGQLAAGRSLQQAVLLPDGTVFVCGGADAAGNALNSAEVFDPVSGKTSELPVAMLRKRYYHRTVLLDTGMVLIT